MVFDGMESRGHERVVFVNEPDVGLRAIIAIHDTTLGPGLGGVRRWYYPNEAAALDDVLRLSQAMTYKNAAAGLRLGGGKSVIMLDDPEKPRSAEEARAMGRAVRGCGGEYIAAEDVGINEEFVDYMAEECRYVTGGVRLAPGGDPGKWTAQTVVNGMRAAIRFVEKDHSPALERVSVNIMGLGSVGMNIARILRDAGATIRGFDISDTQCERARDEFGVEILDAKSIYTTSCDIFAPCALGGVIHDGNISDLNCRVVCGAANNPLDHPERHALALAQRGVVYAPDFIVNSGGVIQLGCAWFQWDEAKREKMITGVEDTTIEVLTNAAKASTTTQAAALAYAEQRIREGCGDTSSDRRPAAVSN